MITVERAQQRGFARAVRTVHRPSTARRRRLERYSREAPRAHPDRPEAPVSRTIDRRERRRRGCVPGAAARPGAEPVRERRARERPRKTTRPRSSTSAWVALGGTSSIR